jgi:hypothetical protein
VWSFERTGLGEKFLEEGEDFHLENLSTEGLLMGRKQRTELLAGLLAPRISRHALLKGRTLEEILGKTPYTFNELAWTLKGQPTGTYFEQQDKGPEHKPKITYGGTEIFSGIWSSDTRDVIRLFCRMIDEVEGSLEDTLGKSRERIVPMNVQDKVLREAGGAFLNRRLPSAIPPTQQGVHHGSSDRSYGEHLCKIAKAFQQIAEHELLTFTSMNEGKECPKQARRIEIVDTNKPLPDDLNEYYLGLLRYGVFFRDFRAKSVRKQVTSRLVLRGLLIPYFTLSPSRRDSVSMCWNDFCLLLKDPDRAATDWPTKRQLKKEEPQPYSTGQTYIDGLDTK